MTRMPPPINIGPTNDIAMDFIPVSNDQLTSELTRLAGHINAAEYRFLKLLAALIDREAWGGDSGMKTPAHWLNYYCGIDLGAAREKVRVAKALRTLPKIDAGFASGALSYSKVRAMTRCATVENEEILLEVARNGTAAHLEKLVRQHRRVKQLDGQKQAESMNREQALSYYYDDDGMLVLNGRFPAEDGAVVIKALQAIMDSITRDNNSDLESALNEEVPEESAEETLPRKCGDEDVAEAVNEKPDDAEPAVTLPRKRAEALLQMAEHFLACPGQNTASLPNGDKYQVLVHLDLRQHSESVRISGSSAAYLEEGPPLGPETIERLSCDASLVPVLRDQTGNVLNIGRKSRAVPPAIHRALKIRDGGCRFPGCTQTRHVDAHHIKHWSHGGETSLDNLVLLCRHHHRLLHEGEFEIEKDRELSFVDRQGRTVRATIFPQFVDSGVEPDGTLIIESDNERAGLTIDSTTAVSQWQGEHMDYSLAVSALQDLDSRISAG